MAWRKSPPQLIDAFDKVLPRDNHVERRKMFGYPAAFVNGYLFAGLHQEDVIVRLSLAQRQALAKAGGGPWAPHPGRVMREYMKLPCGAPARVMAQWLKKACAYTQSLPAKKPRKPRATKQKRPRV